jgi:peptidylprolyl isomerase
MRHFASLAVIALLLSPVPVLAQAVTATPPAAPAPTAAAPAPATTTTTTTTTAPTPAATAPTPTAAAPVATTTPAVAAPTTATQGTPPVTTTPAPATPPAAAATDPENTINLDLPGGRVVIQLRPDLAPNTVARIKTLTRQNFYDGLVFHRVIDGFMAQTGDPKGDGTGGSGQKLNAEFTKTPHTRGAVSMARAADVNSADSQFFIVTADSNFLDGQYTVFGFVTSGMEAVDKLRKGPRANNGMVDKPDRITKMSIAADKE